jgi:hypothetical protein
MSETEQLNNMAFDPLLNIGPSPWRSRPIVAPEVADALGNNANPFPTPPSFGNYEWSDSMQMGPMYDPNDARADYEPSPSYEMPEFGSDAYQQQMGHAMPVTDKSKQLPKFDPYSGADWLRGVGLFAKGALFGAPKEAGPADSTSKSGKNVSKESTFDQKDYWGWLFNS